MMYSQWLIGNPLPTSTAENTSSGQAVRTAGAPAVQLTQQKLNEIVGEDSTYVAPGVRKAAKHFCNKQLREQQESQQYR